jgi:hypothetical protein
MSSKAPPVPPANRSDKGPGEPARPTSLGEAKGDASGNKANPSKTGQAGNSKVNTTNQGHQQDR